MPFIFPGKTTNGWTSSRETKKIKRGSVAPTGGDQHVVFCFPRVGWGNFMSVPETIWQSQNCVMTVSVVTWDCSLILLVGGHCSWTPWAMRRVKKFTVFCKRDPGLWNFTWRQEKSKKKREASRSAEKCDRSNGVMPYHAMSCHVMPPWNQFFSWNQTG